MENGNDPGGSTTIRDRGDGVRVIRIAKPEDAARWRAAFAGAYQEIFSAPPYNERFFPSEADAVLRRYLETPGNLTLLAVRGLSQVVGFGIGVPAVARQDITHELRGLIELRHTYYLAELGVLPSYRRAGLGREMVSLRLDLIDRTRFSNVVLRTSAERNASYRMYMSLGFEDMGVYMEVPSRRQDGRVSTDRRLFLSKVLPAPDSGVEEEVGDPKTWSPEADF